MSKSGSSVFSRQHRKTDVLGVGVYLVVTSKGLVITRRDTLLGLQHKLDIGPRQARAAVSSYISEGWTEPYRGLNEPFSMVNSLEERVRVHRDRTYESRGKNGRLGGRPPKPAWDVSGSGRLANLQVVETIVTVPQESRAAFVPEVWPVPIAPPALRTDSPLPEARRRPGPSRLERQADRPAAAVARNDRELYSDIQSHLCGEVLRILTAAEASIGRDDIAAKLPLSQSGEEGRALRKVLNLLRTEGTVIRKPAEAGAGRFVYGIAPLPADVDSSGWYRPHCGCQVSGCGPGRPLEGGVSSPSDRSL